MWVAQGRCWLLLGLELEVDAGSRHWMRGAPRPWGSEVALRDSLCC